MSLQMQSEHILILIGYFAYDESSIHHIITFLGPYSLKDGIRSHLRVSSAPINIPQFLRKNQ